MPDGPITEAQWALAKKLGLHIPRGATKYEFSTIYSNYIEGVSPAGPEIRQVAEYFGATPCRFASDTVVHFAIFNSLVRRQDDNSLCLWFCMKVAVSLGYVTIDQVPPRQEVVRVSDTLAEDAKIVSSVKRYGSNLEGEAEDPIPFGDNPDFPSVRTYAYKAAKKLLDAEFQGEDRAFTQSSRTTNEEAIEKDGRHLTAYIIMLVILGLIYSLA